MRSNRRRRLPSLQLELPLGSQPTTPPARPGPAGGEATGSVADRTTDEWHLDEQTRRIGRQGVATARALLAGAPPEGRGGSSGRGRGPAGRAA